MIGQAFPFWLLLFDPTAVVVGLVLGWLVSGWKGIALTGAVLASIGLLSVIFATVTILRMSGAAGAELNGYKMALGVGVNTLGLMIIKTVFAMFWTLVAQLVRRSRSGGSDKFVEKGNL